MARLSKSDYHVLDQFIRAALIRVEAGHLTAADALADIMHPLTAWDNGDQQEFIPFMQLMLSKWKADKA